MIGMISAVLGSKAIKITGGVGLSTALFAAVVTLIDNVEKTTKVYVDTKHSQTIDHVQYLKEGQEDIKKMLRDINNHLLRQKRGKDGR